MVSVYGNCCFLVREKVHLNVLIDLPLYLCGNKIGYFLTLRSYISGEYKYLFKHTGQLKPTQKLLNSTFLPKLWPSSTTLVNNGCLL